LNASRDGTIDRPQASNVHVSLAGNAFALFRVREPDSEGAAVPQVVQGITTGAWDHPRHISRSEFGANVTADNQSICQAFVVFLQ